LAIKIHYKTDLTLCKHASITMLFTFHLVHPAGGSKINSAEN